VGTEMMDAPEITYWDLVWLVPLLILTWLIVVPALWVKEELLP
jgi:hypothetical protein